MSKCQEEKPNFFQILLAICLVLWFNLTQGGDNMVKSVHSTIFAKNLNKYMDLLDIKQTDIVRRLKVSKTTVSTWCAGEYVPRVDKLQALADWFRVGMSDLLEDKKTVIDEANIKSTKQLTKEEHQLIKKYRSLDESGKRTVDMIIEDQYKRCMGDRDAEFSSEVC